MDDLGGTKTGVFVGVTGTDYSQSIMQQLPPSELDAYVLTGTASTFAAGRLSYWLGLQGPSLSLDTACSSSLVAVHLACQSLRAGECSMALAGGVNTLLAPEGFVVLSRANMLSPDGRCKTFDKDANGYVRGEGCGVVVLKRLADAVAEGDHIHAVIRGSAVNQDGRSSGITVPNGNAQQAVIRDALATAGVAGARVGYVEAHGTGTALGDPIEVRALSAVLGEGRDPASPIALGSVKTNIGHLEPAAGVAGLIKTVLALRNEQIPPLLHLREVNPEIEIDKLPVSLPTTLTPWRRHLLARRCRFHREHRTSEVRAPARHQGEHRWRTGRETRGFPRGAGRPTGVHRGHQAACTNQSRLSLHRAGLAIRANGPRTLPHAARFSRGP
jgi:acyl transferase domain-containing protein